MLRHRNALNCMLAAAVVIALVMLFVPAAMAQDQPVPKAEVFIGYSWLDPNGSIPYQITNQCLFTGVGGTSQASGAAPTPDAMCGGVSNASFKVPTFKYGWGGAVAYPIKPYAAIVADFSGHYDGAIHTIMFGPQFKWRTEHLSPFGEVLLGWARISPGNPPALPPPIPTSFLSHTAFAMGGGGGLDLTITRHLALRLIQADYIYTTYRDKAGPFPYTNSHLKMARIQGGLVLSLGLPAEETPLSLVCSASPTPVLAGEPVTVTSTATNSMMKRTLTYSFTGNGIKLAPHGNTAGVDTTGLAPGDYPVNCGVVDDGKGKHQRSASAKTSFSIKEPPKHPPVASCQISATQVMKGDPVKVTVAGTNPDNRPLSYSCTATAGRLSGSGTSYTLDTASAQGPVRVNCTVSDDRGLNDSCNVSVTVNVPPPPPTASKVNSIDFYTCDLTPKHMLGAARVDNCAKAILDEYALRLQREADATGVIVGYASEAELKEKKNKKNQDLAGQRAFNTKMYLVQEKGIDPRRFTLYTGTGEERADLWLVPPGATFNASGVTPFDDSKMKVPVVKTAVAPVKKAMKPAAKATKKP